MTSRKAGWHNISATIALFPTMIVILCIYLFGLAWTFWISLTSSKLIPVNSFVGLDQYERLFSTSLWMRALANLGVFSTVFILGSLLLGYALAACLDKGVRFERVFIAVILLPSALSPIVVGLAWKWLLNPTFGLQSVVQNIGWSSFTLDWPTNGDMAIYAIVFAAIWHSAGITMIILLAAMRGVNQGLWNVAAVDGVGRWRMYVSVVPGLIWPSIMTAAILLFIASIKVFELVLALTGGGPGSATEMPSTFVMSMLFERSNIGQASAAAIVLLACVSIGLIVITLLRRQYRGRIKDAA